MGSRILSPEQIPSVIAEHIADSRSIFVFSTGTAANLWADWTIRHPEKTGATAVATERFIAWDDFKSASIRTQKQTSTSIPSVLRKFFAASLIRENAAGAAGGSPVFRSIVNPLYADSASSFADWMAGLLPSLALWKQKFDAADKSDSLNSGNDAENADYLTLYARYSGFLAENNLFDPAWEKPPFRQDGNSYIIFYPETFEDYADYRDLLASAPSVTTILLPPAPEKHPTVDLYPNARTELRTTALRIRRLHEKSSVPWADIAVSVPDIQLYGPYIEREFKLYCIPYSLRAGRPLTSNSAGQIFREIRDCVSSGFTYDSVRTLLLDQYVPWKDNEENERLVKFGSVYKCICPYTDANGKETDPWKAAFAANAGWERELTMYDMLNRDLTRMYKAKDFESIQSAWFIFRKNFLNDTFSQEADLILGRCLAELSSLIDIERQYVKKSGLELSSPYDFFVGELDDCIYVPQSLQTGVSVLPYKLCAEAPFPYQLVIDASQNSLTVPYRPLSFLREDKRKALGIEDDRRSSDAFVRLYAKNTAYFSCSIQTFSGYAVPYSYLTPNQTEKSSAEAADDFLMEEKDFLLSGNAVAFPKKISDIQKEGFLAWADGNRGAPDDSGSKAGSDTVSDRIRTKFYYPLRKTGPTPEAVSGKSLLHVAETDMNKFFSCPLKWLFSGVLAIREDSLDTNLMDKYVVGTINHHILELYLGNLKMQNRPVPVQEENSGLEETIGKLLPQAAAGTRNIPLVHAVLLSQKQAICGDVAAFLRTFSEFFGGCRILETEQRCDVLSKDGMFVYTGQPDCILCDDDGNVTIVDFKKNSPPKTTDCIANEKGELANFQLAMYTYLWNSNHTKAQRVQNALFFSVSKAEPAVVFGRITDRSTGRVAAGKVPDAEAFESTVRLLTAYAEKFADCVEKTDFSAAVTTPFSTCATCAYSTICRTTYNVSGVRNRPIRKHTEKNADAD